MVRIMVPFGNSRDAAEKTAVEIASHAAPELPAFVPE
jgi:hypothetical protein